MAQGKYADVNGLEMYYEIHGNGKPLVLLHGALGGVDMFSQLLPGLEKVQTIAVELQGNGHTADIDRPFSFEQMADDVAALIQRLGLKNADVGGYSLGGGVALQTAIRHPDVVRKLVVISTVFKSSGWYPESRTGMKAMNAEVAKTWIGSPMHEAYVKSAPNPGDWPNLVAKTGLVVGQDYDWSKDVAGIKLPTLIVAGDADGVRTAHAEEFFELLGDGQRDGGWDGSGISNARLAILPGTTHMNIIFSPMLASIITAFLDEPMSGRK